MGSEERLRCYTFWSFFKYASLAVSICYLAVRQASAVDAYYSSEDHCRECAMKAEILREQTFIFSLCAHNFPDILSGPLGSVPDGHYSTGVKSPVAWAVILAVMSSGLALVCGMSWLCCGMTFNSKRFGSRERHGIIEGLISFSFGTNAMMLLASVYSSGVYQLDNACFVQSVASPLWSGITIVAILSVLGLILAHTAKLPALKHVAWILLAILSCAGVILPLAKANIECTLVSLAIAISFIEIPNFLKSPDFKFCQCCNDLCFGEQLPEL